MDLFEDDGYEMLIRAFQVRAEKIDAILKGFDKNAVEKNNKMLELDRLVFKRLTDLLPWNGSIRFVRERNFAGWGFDIDEHNDLRGFCLSQEHVEQSDKSDKIKV